MSEELVQIHQNNAVILAGAVDMTGLDDVRIKPTNVILVQPMTQDPRNARPGQFLDELSGEVYDELIVVPLRVSKPRVKYPDGAAFGVEPICRSDDGFTPSAYAKVPQAKSCGGCIHGKWYNGKKPSCKESYKLLVIVKETGLPRRFQAGGMGFRPTREMLECIKQDIVISKKKTGVQYNLFDYYFRLHSHKNTGQQGMFYTPRYSDFKKVATPGEFGPLYEEYVVNYKLAQNEEDVSMIDASVTDVVAEVVDAEIVEV